MLGHNRFAMIWKHGDAKKLVNSTCGAHLVAPAQMGYAVHFATAKSHTNRGAWEAPDPDCQELKHEEKPRPSTSATSPRILNYFPT